MTTPAAERDVRVGILNSFLTTPHRKLDELAPLHTQALERDPLFYSRLALWYMETGEVRDHKVLFVAHLLTCDYAEFREAGWVLLQGLAPFEVARVLDHAKRVIGKAPRVLRSAVAHYLRTREANPRQFDGAALRARNDLKHLYASLRLKPGPRAQAILFDEQPPEDSTLAALKRLARAQTAEEQAAIILEHRIPYTTAIGALAHVTPALLVALITAMSPQEVVNNLGALKRRGALDDKDVKALIDQKLQAAVGDRRVSTMKAKRAMQAVDLDAETARTLTRVCATLPTAPNASPACWRAWMGARYCSAGPTRWPTRRTRNGCARRWRQRKRLNASGRASPPRSATPCSSPRCGPGASPAPCPGEGRGDAARLQRDDQPRRDAGGDRRGVER